MNFYEKYTNSKFYHVIDIIFKVLVVNLLSIITWIIGLFVFTFGPSLISLVKILKMIFTGDERPVYKLYFYNFKKYFNKGLNLNLFYFLILGILSFNIYFFYIKILQNKVFLNYFVFMLSIAIFFITLIAFFESSMLLSININLEFIKLIKYGFLYSIGLAHYNLLFVILILLIAFITYLIIPLGIIIGAFMIGTLTYFLIYIPINKSLKIDYKKPEEERV